MNIITLIFYSVLIQLDKITSLLDYIITLLCLLDFLYSVLLVDIRMDRNMYRCIQELRNTF